MTTGTQLPINFHNTIQLTGKELDEAIMTAKSQEERIYLLMTGKSAMTPFEVMDLYNSVFPIVPITSIRRALSNLENQNKLIKTHWSKLEQYGKPNYKWMVVK
jgi:hypothetical protein